MTTIFDIESGPLDNLIPPEFEPPSNYKDPEKIAAWLECKTAKWIKDAALSSLSGRVLAIGYYTENHIDVYGFPNERELLASFWHHWHEPGDLCGFAVKSFDLPFIIQRSIITNVPVSSDIMDGRYWSRRIVDLEERWHCYSHRIDDKTGHSLANICKACGLGTKNGNGADFARLWTEDRDAAIAYLKDDLRLTAALAERLGVK